MNNYYKIFKKTCKHFTNAASCAKSYFCCSFVPYAKSLLSYYFYISLLKSFFELTLQNFVYLIHLIVGPVEPSLTFLVLTMTFSFFLFLVSKVLTTFVKTDEQLQSILRFLTPDLTTLFLGSINYLAATVLHFYEICSLFFSKNWHALLRAKSAHLHSQTAFLQKACEWRSKPQLCILCKVLPEAKQGEQNFVRRLFEGKTPKDLQVASQVKVSQEATLKVIFYAFIIISIFFLVQMTLVSPASAMENPFETPGGKQTQIEASLNEEALVNDNDSAFRRGRESFEPQSANVNEQILPEAQKQSFGEEVDGSKRKFSEEGASKAEEPSLAVKRAKEKEYRAAKIAKLNNYSPVDIQLHALVREARKTVGLKTTRLESNATKIYEDTLKKAKLALETGSSQLGLRSQAETNRRLIAYGKEVGSGSNPFLNAVRRERIAQIDEMEAFTSEQVLAHHEKNLKTLLTIEEFKNPAGFSARNGESKMFKQLQAYVEKNPGQFDLMPDSYFSVRPKNDLVLPIVGQPLAGVESSFPACASDIDKNLANSGVATAFDFDSVNPQSLLPLDEHMFANGDFSESDVAAMASHFFDLPE